MGVLQQQSTNNSAINENVVQPLQLGILQRNSFNYGVNIDYEERNVLMNVSTTINEYSTDKFHRSKRFIKSLVNIYRGLTPLQKLDLGFLIKEGVDIGIDGFYKIKDTFERYFGSSAGSFTALPLEQLERHIMHDDLSRKLSENYWAIDQSHDLLSGFKDLVLGNKDLLLVSQGLLLANTGVLIGAAFMLMNINSKLDRNYEAILRLETKVDRNYDAIRSVESKVDRNLKVMLSGFKILENNLTNVMERGFKEVIDFVRQTRVEGVTSELITFIRHFIQEKNSIRNLTHDQYVTKLEEVNGILHRLQNSRMPQSGSLHTLLYNIVNQKFAIPENSNDRVALTALGLLCSGTGIYASVLFFLLEEYSYLANFYYQQNDLDKYNHYFSLVSTTYNDFNNSLAGENGLIDEIIRILKQVKSYDFIKDEREDIVEFASKRIDSFDSVKSKLAIINNLSAEKSTEKIKYNFSNSQIATPIGKWEDRRKVSYAIQFQGNGTDYQVGEWSSPARVYRKTNPLLDIGIDPGGRIRLIFRKFDNDKPELVGIVEDSDKKEFRDINRDLYNAVLEPNEDIAMDEMEVFLANGADINARYEIGRQAIHAAAENGNTNIILALKNRGADINARDLNGYAPIHVAAEVGFEDFTKDLVANGADVNAKTSLGSTALHIAAEKGHLNTVISLIQIKGIDINAKDQRGFTPLHAATSFGKNSVLSTLSQDNRTDVNAQSEVGFTPLHLAAIGEYSAAVEAVLGSDRVDVNAKTNSGLTALHFASMVGNLGIAKHIMGRIGVDINVKSADGWTPLHLAINSKKENVTLELLSNDKIEVNEKGKDDLMPLHLAASSGQKRIISKLLEKDASIEDIDKYGCTPLHFAVESGDLEVVKYLIEKGANLYEERKDGYTPLGLAAYNGQLNVVQFLVNNKGVNVNTKNKNSMTPIDFAASNGYFSIVEFLIDKGANKESALHWAAYGGHLNIVRYLADEKHFDSNKKDKYGNIPVHNAALQGHLNVVKYFVDGKQVGLNTRNKAGYTPFLFAILGGNLDMIKYFVDEKSVDLNSSPNKSDNNGSTVLHLAALNSNLGVIKYLIRKGSNVSAVDNYGNTPLFQATSRGHLDTVIYLIQKGANFEAANNYNSTILQFAAWNGYLNIVKYFVEKGADLNAANNDGNTALHLAASIDITKYLVEKGANLRAISKDGYTPLHEAAAIGNLDIVKFLVEQGINIHIRVIRNKKKSNNGKTVLHLAAQNGRLDLVEYLIRKGAEVSFKDDSGKTSKDLADENSHIDVVKFLEEVQLNMNLLNAVKQGSLNKVKEYISNGASIEVKDKNGDALQEIASRNGNIEITEFLKQKELDSNLVDVVMQGNFTLVKEYIARGASLEAKDKDGHGLPYLASQNYEIEQLLKQAQLNLNLMNAVKKDNLDMVKEISREASLETKDKNGNTLLHLAASRGHLDIAKYLIEKGADFNATNMDNSTPLHTAASNGKLNVVKYLIEEKETNLEVKDKNGNTPLSLAAQSGHLGTVKYLAEKEGNLRVTNENGNTPLHEAASHGELDVAKYFVEEKGVNFKIKDDNGNTPLILAAQRGHLDIVKYLAGKGADTSALGGYLDTVKTIIDGRSIDARDSEGNISLHLAISSGYLGIVKHLVIEGANLHATNGNGRTPLHVAVEKGYIDIVIYLVEKGADLNASDNRGASPLHLAVVNDKLDVVKYLVEEKGVSFEARDNGGNSPLHLAASNGKFDVVKYLVEKGAHLETKNNDNYSPLRLAAQNGYLDTFKYLIENGADASPLSGYLDAVRTIIDERSIEARDDNNNTSLHLAVSSGYLGIVKYLMAKGVNLNSANKDGRTPLHNAAERGYLEMVKYFAEKGANLDAADNQGITPLYCAALNNDLSIVKYLIEEKGVSSGNIFDAAKNGYLGIVRYLVSKGSDPKDKDDKGKTPLHYAALNDRLDVVKYLVDEKGVTTQVDIFIAADRGFIGYLRYLVDKGDNVNARGFRDKTPLHYAVCNDDTRGIKFLLDNGANINAKDKFGDTPIHTAAKRGCLDSVKYLVERGADFRSRNSYDWPWGRTPLTLASQMSIPNHVKTAEYLRSIGARRRRSIENNDSVSVSAMNSQALSGVSKSSLLGTVPKPPALPASRGHDGPKVAAGLEINSSTVNNALMLGILTANLVNKTQYKQPIHENLLSPREHLMGSIDDSSKLLKEALWKGKEEDWGSPRTDEDEE